MLNPMQRGLRHSGRGPHSSQVDPDRLPLRGTPPARPLGRRRGTYCPESGLRACRWSRWQFDARLGAEWRERPSRGGGLGPPATNYRDGQHPGVVWSRERRVPLQVAGWRGSCPVPDRNPTQGHRQPPRSAGESMERFSKRRPVCAYTSPPGFARASGPDCRIASPIPPARSYQRPSFRS